MYIDNIILENIKSFKGHNQQSLSKSINTIVGINNSGKSTIIKSILMLQYGVGIIGKNVVRNGETKGMIRLGISEPGEKIFPQMNVSLNNNGIYFNWRGTNSVENFQLKTKDLANYAKVGQIPQEEPSNFIYPHLSTRNQPKYVKAISKTLANQVNLELHNIYPKIDRIINSRNVTVFQKECKNILDIDIGTILTNEGREAGLNIDDVNQISVEDMGDGLPKLIGFILDLCIAEGKLFIIEEPENDIHPGALKALLDLIVRKSSNNQFIVTTHSNIVTKYLGSVENSKLIKLSHKNDQLPPVSQMQEIGNDPIERKKVLYELGYDMMDFDLWEGFLLFEESSAERIVRDIIMPLVNKNLNSKLCTIASNGIDDVNKRFINLHQTMVYLHRTPIYQDKTWVMVDSHSKSETYRNELIGQFKDWSKDQFKILKQTDFEKYYPEQFQEKVDKVLQITDKQEKRNQKKLLCAEVVKWANENPKKDVKDQFLKSAKEVINILEKIDKKL